MFTQIQAGIAIVVTLVILSLVGALSYLRSENDELRQEIGSLSEKVAVSNKEKLKLEFEISEFKANEVRKATVLATYLEIDKKLTDISYNTSKVLKGFTARNTEDEKCLDLTPPAELIRLLEGNNSPRPDIPEAK